MDTEEMRKIIEGAITEHCEGGDLYLCSMLAAKKIEKALAPEKHYPEEWGPSDAKRLSCVCGNQDPFHATQMPGESKDAARYRWLKMQPWVKTKGIHAWGALLDDAIDEARHDAPDETPNVK